MFAVGLDGTGTNKAWGIRVFLLWSPWTLVIEGHFVARLTELQDRKIGNQLDMDVYIYITYICNSEHWCLWDLIKEAT